MKFECMNEQYAIIATLRLKRLGRKAIRLGRAVVTDSPSDNWFCRVYVEAHAYTTTETEYDLERLRNEP